MKNFTFRYVIMSVVKVTFSGHLEIKLVTVTEYAVKNSIKKNDSIKNVGVTKNLLMTLTLNLTLRSIWVRINSAS